MVNFSRGWQLAFSRQAQRKLRESSKPGKAREEWEQYWSNRTQNQNTIQQWTVKSMTSIVTDWNTIQQWKVKSMTSIFLLITCFYSGDVGIYLSLVCVVIVNIGIGWGRYRGWVGDGSVMLCIILSMLCFFYPCFPDTACLQKHMINGVPFPCAGDVHILFCVCLASLPVLWIRFTPVVWLKSGHVTYSTTCD